jgi:hypothetical protein
MEPRVPKRLIVSVVATLGVIGLVAAVAVWRLGGHDQTSFAWAVGHAPEGTQRVSWTDWAQVRAEEHATLSARSPASDVRKFLDKAYDDDLTSTSALVDSAPVLQEKFGLSPASIDWELFDQSYQGAVVMMHVPDAVDFGDLADHLESLGFTRPDDPTGVWGGGSDVLASISPNLTPELSYFALDEHDSLVLTSDTSAYLTLALRAVHGDDPSVAGLGAVVDDAGSPVSAAVYTGDYACGALAMAHAGSTDQAEARRLVAGAGRVNPYSAFAMSDEPDGSVRVAFEFDDPTTARTNADSRSVLARGPAPGQGGSFRDRFRVESVTETGSLVVLRLAPQPGAYVLSDLSTGPLLFATC